MAWGGKRVGSGRKKILSYMQRNMIAEIYRSKVTDIINARTRLRMEAAYKGTEQDELNRDINQLSPNWLYQGRNCITVALEVADSGEFLTCNHVSEDCLCVRINDTAEALIHKRESIKSRPRYFMGRKIRNYKKEAIEQTAIEFEELFQFKPSSSQIEKCLREFPKSTLIE